MSTVPDRGPGHERGPQPPPPPPSPGEAVAAAADEEEEEEELECRVCREGRSQGPLLRPCKCAGSIMFAHQDCLLQWLRHSGKESCELCKHRFAFRPVYAPDAPAQVPAAEVGLRCLRKAACEYLPFLARLGLAAGLWLGVVPCTTSWVFRIWIRRASFLVPDLVRRRILQGGGGMLWNDVVSGIIIAAFIIFSFLSLMSFADFLRFHWDVRDDNHALGGGGVVEEEPPQHHHHHQPQPVPPPMGGEEEAAPQRPPTPPHDARMAEEEEEEEEEEDDESSVEGEEEDEDGEAEDEAPPPPPQQPPQHPPPVAPVAPAAVLNNGNGNGNNNANAADNDADVELQVAVDELLGVRGPFPFLLRNILWLLAFNGAYLGLFAFIPYSVGAAVVGAAEKYAGSPPLRLLLRLLVPAPVCQLAVAAARAAAEEDYTLQLGDLGVVVLGYGVLAAMVFTWRSVVCAVCARAGRALPLLWGRVVRVLECTAAVVKVGLLLSLKMLFLPLLLGLWLDAATQPVLGPPFPDRVRFATENLVGALLLHWVAGISFMLLVTVSVLQLREVLHPACLARVIRPQEPQPDLLGSLLQEPGLTHARRMGMSLAIYVALLALFVWLPARALPRWWLGGSGDATAATATAAGGGVGGPFPLQLRTCYLAPQLQIPLELILLHLAMLALLEHAKGAIGRLQHLWLRPLCAALGLTRFLLPCPARPASDQQRGAAAVGAAVGPEEDSEEEEEEWRPAPDAPGLLVGAPLRRPPPGELWEEDGAGGTERGRWAWGQETPSQVERALAPRARPRFCLLRLAVLLALSWAAVLALVVSALLLPLLLGRAAFALLHIPARFGHDPLAFALGVTACWGVHKWSLRLQQRVTPQALAAWRAGFWRAQPSLRQLGTAAAFFAVWTAASPLLVGGLFELALVLPSEAWAAKGLRALHWGQDWVLGVWLLHELVYLGYLGLLDRMAGGPPQPQPQGNHRGAEGQGQGQGQGQARPPATHQAALCLTLNSLRAVFLQWDWGKATAANLLHPFVLPLAGALLEAAALPTVAAVALPLLRARFPGLAAGLLFLPPLPSSAGTEPAAGLSDAELQLAGFRMTALAWALAALAGKCKAPLDRWLARVRAAVRDEKYLVRLELVDFRPERVTS